MKAIIDMVLLGILILCVWAGYKKGLLMGIAGILCIVISVYGANLLSNAFSYDVVPALRPFISGYTESMLKTGDTPVRQEMGWDDYDLTAEDLLAQYPERKAEFCTACFRAVGVSSPAAEHLADKAIAYAEDNGGTVTNAVVHTLSSTISYVMCFTLAFLLILIILTVIGNLPNLSYKLPNLDLVNDIGGAVLGLVRGLLFCALLVWLLKFLGIILGQDTLADSTLGGWLLKRDFFFKYLGI